MNRRAFIKFVPALSALFLASDKSELIVPDEPKRITFGTESTQGTSVPSPNIKINYTVNSRARIDVEEVARQVGEKIVRSWGQI